MLNRFRIFLLLLFSIFFLIGCNQSESEVVEMNDFEIKKKGALLTTRFTSFEAFKKEVEIEYSADKKSWVRLTQKENGLSSILKKGIKESEIMKVRDGGLLSKVWLVSNSPYFTIHRRDILKVYLLSRRRYSAFGGGDVAFYDLAKRMMGNINNADLAKMNEEDISEKGYINTFNHVVGQALMTAIFSKKLAGFLADSHERSNMPALISGDFTEEQLKDIKNGAVDNYVDIINNGCGQRIGQKIIEKYKINQETIWTAGLLANILNDMQSYFSWNFQIGFKPFKPTDEIMRRFSKKINKVMTEDLLNIR